MKPTVALTLGLLTAAVLAQSSFAGPEQIEGKDMKSVVQPVQENCTWAGFYLGGHVGYGWSNPDANVDPLPHGVFTAAVPTDVDLNPNGIVGGGQIGYNFEFGHFVVGGEADFSASDIGDSATHKQTLGAFEVQYHTEESIDWYGTARLRLGFAPSCRFLLYGTGGLAFGQVNHSGNLSFTGFTAPQYPASNDDTKVGWTGGAGMEFSLNRHWSIKAEYLYIDLGDESINGPAVPPSPTFHVHYNWDTTVHTVNVGLNYRF
jgi:outer membrane immunogenic protein